jgi:hypothetical protein
MNRLTIATIVTVGVLAGLAGSVEACYCGAARRAACCDCSAPQQTCTVMKTCQKVVYQQKQETCFRTEYKPVWDFKSVTGVCNVAETRYQENVRTFYRPVYEDTVREVPCIVMKPVKEMRTIKVCGGHWETKNVETCVPNPSDPCTTVKATKQCRVWKPEIVDQQVECVRCVPETVMKKETYQVCKMVTDQTVDRIPYTVIVPKPYQTTVRCVRYVETQVPYTVTRCVPVTVTVQVPVQVCCPVPACCGK